MPSVRKQGNLSFQNNFHEQLYFLLYEVHAKYQLNLSSKDLLKIMH